MKKSKIILLGLGLVLSILIQSCQFSSTNNQTEMSNIVTDIVGRYNCSGECVVTTNDSIRSLIHVTVETDVIQNFPNSRQGLYQIDITGANNFHEIEIGALSGNVLRTATSKVSDAQYPVLEEYIFDTNAYGQAVGYTKIVRNPTSTQFKTCAIYCVKDVSDE